MFACLSSTTETERSRVLKLCTYILDKGGVCMLLEAISPKFDVLLFSFLAISYRILEIISASNHLCNILSRMKKLFVQFVRMNEPLQESRSKEILLFHKNLRIGRF